MQETPKWPRGLKEPEEVKPQRPKYPYSRSISSFQALPGFHTKNYPYFIMHDERNNVLLCNFANFEVL